MGKYEENYFKRFLEIADLMQRPLNERIYIKASYNSKETLKYYKAIYDSKYHKWFTFSDSEYYDEICQMYQIYTTDEWEKYKAEYDPTKHVRSQRKPVRCIETGEIFPSISKACSSYNLDKSNFSRAIKNGHKIGAYHWEFIE